MSNQPNLHLTMLDRLAAELPEDVRHEIILDLDAFERDGVSRDGPLRTYAGKFYRKLHGLEVGFDAGYLSRLGMSCHKLNSIAAMTSPQGMALEDLALRLARIPTRDERTAIDDAMASAQASSSGGLDEQFDELVRRARTLMGVEEAAASGLVRNAEDEEGPGL